MEVDLAPSIMKSSALLAVRRATANDAAEILNCLRLAFEPFRDQYTPAGFEDTVLTPETFARRLRDMIVFVAVTTQDEVIGTVSCQVHNGEGHIRGMAVWPSWQGHGVAELLLGSVEQQLRSDGCSQIRLGTTQVLARAIRFYDSHGFRPTGHVGDFFGMRMLEYVKDLKS